MDANNLRDNDSMVTKQVYADTPEPTGQTEADQVVPDATQEVTTPEPSIKTPQELEANSSEQTPEQPVESDSSHSASTRVRELNDKVNAGNEKIESLNDTIAELSGVNRYLPQVGQPYQPAKPGSVVTPEQYQQDVINTANAMVDLKLAQERNLNRIEKELTQAVATYSELNKDHESFNKDLSRAVKKAVNAFVTTNPAGNVREFVDGLMKPYRDAVSKEVGRQSQTVAKQAQQTAIRPTQTPQVTKKSPDEESIEEMEARLGKVF